MTNMYALIRTVRQLAVLLMGLVAYGGTALAVTFVNTPAVVSNSYLGKITLQIGGVTNGESAVVQEFLDANTNGVIDGGDWRVQQFLLTDGVASVIGGVTNINVPGDTTTTDGTIIAQLNYQTSGPGLALAGRYLYKLVSPTGNWLAVTNEFNVTNVPYGQAITGSVGCSGTNVPYAVVLAFSGPAFDSSPVAGVVADNAGGYRLPLVPGTYSLMAFKRNYVGSGASAPWVVLGSGATASTNLSLLPATCSISGRVQDAANSSVGLPGLWVFPASADYLIGVGITDGNGNFSAGVTTNEWEIQYNDMQVVDLGYVGLGDRPVANTTTGSVSGVTMSLPKATALFYGQVTDEQSHLLPGLGLWADGHSGNYEASGRTDENGNYVLATVGGTWDLGPATDDDPLYAGYVSPRIQAMSISAGQAVRLDFMVLLATNQISGYVKDTSNNPVSGVNVWVNALIGGTNYQADVSTDESGHYAINVCNGTWGVGVSCDDLSDRGYECPNYVLVNIAGANVVTNFTVAPSVLVDVRSYSVSKSVSFWQGGPSSLILNTNHGPFTATLSIVQSSPDAVPIATATLPNGEVRGFPRVTSNAEMQVQEMFSSQGELDAHYGSGTYAFAMATRHNGFQFPELVMPVAVYPTNPPARVSNFAAAQAIAPGSPFTLQWSNPSDATASDYVWVLINDRDGYTVFSTPYPPVSSDASLRGTNTWVEVPANALQPGEGYMGVIVFFRITGVNPTSYPGAVGLTIAVADTAFPMATLSGAPLLSQPARTSGTQFSFVLSGLPGTNYLILATTNVSLPLSQWFPVLTTNLTGSTALIQDNQATNLGRYYRAKVVP